MSVSGVDEPAGYTKIRGRRFFSFIWTVGVQDPSTSAALMLLLNRFFLLILTFIPTNTVWKFYFLHSSNASLQSGPKNEPNVPEDEGFVWFSR